LKNNYFSTFELFSYLWLTHFLGDQKSLYYFFSFFGLWTSLQFILCSVAGFYKLTIPKSPPSYLQDYIICNNARLEFSTILCSRRWSKWMVPEKWSLQWEVWTQDLSYMSLLPTRQSLNNALKTCNLMIILVSRKCFRRSKVENNGSEVFWRVSISWKIF
jgi:hypothetical protein